MIFEIPYWKDGLHAAKTQEDFAQLLKDLPGNHSHLMTRVDQKSSSEVQHPISAPLILNSHKGKIIVG